MVTGYDGRSNEQLLKDYEGQLQMRSQYDQLDKKYGYGADGKKIDASAGTTTGAVDKDWNSSNKDFSWSENSNDLFAKAKEMSEMQLGQSFRMMDASANYRNAEYTHKSGEDRNSYTAKTNDDMRANNNQTDNQIRSYSSQVTNDMRRDGQQQSFQMALQNVNNKHDSGMQQDRFAQERGMFARQDAADNAKTASARAAASSVFKMR